MPGKNNSSKNVSGESSDDARPVVSKDKRFKRIRGLLSGGSRKQKKEKRAREKTKSLQINTKDDDETTFRVNVEERSIATAPPKCEDVTHQALNKAYMLKVVLLLMDPQSRRFELLQLEFDSLKALVSDVMAQIPISVTEDVLRKQTYLGICGHEGKEMHPNSLLSQFCKGNDVLVAIPQGVSTNECARLARPILTDDKVVAMLRSSGIDVSSWIDSRRKTKRQPGSSIHSRNIIVNSDEPSKSNGKAVTFILVILAAILLQVYHLYVSAPIKPGHIVSPGIRLSKCGVFSFFPTCKNAYMSFEGESTIVLRDDSNNLLWQIQGGICKQGDKTCIRGMKFGENGEIIVGGKAVSFIRKFQEDAALSPWPFAEPPTVNIKREVMETAAVVS